MESPIDDMIKRVLNNTATPEEAKYVAELFGSVTGSDELSHLIYKDFQSIKQGVEDIYVDHEIPSQRLLNNIQRKIKRKRIGNLLYKTACVLIPVFLILSAYLQLNSRVDLWSDSHYEEVYVPKGERMQILFQDGTKVYINSDSYLKYPQTFGLANRKIYFEGEAYFDVKANKKRPFIIDLDKASIEVTGTSFNIEAYNGEKKINVTLDEGEINFKTWKNTNTFIQKDDFLTYNKETGEYTILKNSELKSDSKWKNNTIVLKNKPLTEIIKILGRWYNVEFVIINQEALKHSFTMTSEDTLLEKVLAEMEKVGPVRFHYEEGTVTVSMK